MMADHGDPCSEQEASYCMNGGTCYRISSMNTLSCVCNANYEGSRCEHFLLPSTQNAQRAGLIAAVVIVALLILVVLAVVIYFIRKTLKAKKKNQQNSRQEYWKVKPRV